MNVFCEAVNDFIASMIIQEMHLRRVWEYVKTCKAYAWQRHVELLRDQWSSMEEVKVVKDACKTIDVAWMEENI